MLSFNPYTDGTAAALFHLTPTTSSETYQSQLLLLQEQQQQTQTPLINPLPLPMLLQDDLAAGLDFSNPSVQEYIINNDVLDSLAQEAILAENTPPSSLPTNMPNVNSAVELLINTPLTIQTPLGLTAGSHPTILGGSNNSNRIDSSTLNVQIDQFSTMQEETTLSLGIMSHLENLEKQISEMRRFVSAGFAGRDHVRGLDVERQRLASRNYNFQNVTEVNEPFKMLLNSAGAYPSRCPVNGVELKSLNHEEMDALLDDYDLPFSPALFLHEKQLIYLRFVGANRAVMHRVVD
ncbi:hypothetical protein TWF481_007042 [Arthrobotrys musiformis]|uniref:Uncharacterized protein n=1 Tax=Arthrobotrys musiformis TaxID=47236 RepID=A0AAV9WBP2_9PEZI